MTGTNPASSCDGVPPLADVLPPYDAVVLAGGAARRLGGADKPAQQVGGVPMLERVLVAVAGAQRRIVVGPPGTAPGVDVWAREEPPGGGPVPALAAGLAHVRAGWVAVLACDLPFLTAAAVDELGAAALDGDGALAVDADGRDQLLLAVWRTEALRTLPLPAGASLRQTVAPLRVRRVRLRGMPPPELDCDTAADLTAARELA